MRVVVCVARGGVSRGACCGFGASRVSGVIRRHASVLSVCMHPFLSFSSVGQPSVTPVRQGPGQARVMRERSCRVSTRDAARRGQP